MSVVPVVVEAQEATSGGTRETSEKGNIAVGPFVNISGRSSDDWIGYGITETVSADLKQWTTLSVVGRDVLGEELFQSAVGLDDLERVARELGQALGARWLIVGGYQRINERLRITARVLETETGRIETVTRVDGNIAELFNLQDQIVTKLGEGFRVLTNAPMVAAGAVSPNPTPSQPAVATPTDVTGGLSLDTAGAAGFGVAEGAGILTGRPTLRPGRSDVSPEIDGRLDDVIWQDAIHIAEFVQQNPVEGAPATEDTDVWIAYDSQNLYIAVHAHYSDPSIMRANRVDRDQSFDDDNISFYFDTFLDQQRAYFFSVNGYGVQGDAIVNARGGRSNRRRSTGSSSFNRGGIPTGDNSWDALFSSSGQTVDDGYTAELAIPFKSLRYPQREQDLPHRWGFQIVREIRGKDEFQVWAPVTRSVSGFLTQSGLVEGMTNLSLSRNLEVMPTFTGVQYGSLSRQGKFVDGDPSPEGGVNLKYGITSNLIADFTYNPDFSQIESDLPQIEVNQRFSLFYPELRPFFLEGAEIFSPARGMVTFVNTRTIVDPEFGGKVTGKVGNTTVGFMVANDEAPGRTDSSTDTAFGEKAN
ncbi:MAG: FlgO family outer membrane protein, partial [Acidobacteriota bacterium]|nr:FlgO family outer membrane protein [Acidobacteriota bacterium]